MRTFLASIFFLFIPIIAILAIAFYAVNGSISITNYGSTSKPGFTLLINANGSGIWTEGSGNVSPFDSFTVNYDALVKAIRKPEVLKELYLMRPVCATSASFGSKETITYNYLTSGDVSCISDPDFQAALSAAVASGTSQRI